jgi:hypothetical protein
MCEHGRAVGSEADLPFAPRTCRNAYPSLAPSSSPPRMPRLHTKSMTLEMFHPFDQLAVKLLKVSPDDEDGAHDLSHIVRVWRNAKLIHREEGGDPEMLAAAVLLHDCVQLHAQSRATASLPGSPRRASRGASCKTPIV